MDWKRWFKVAVMAVCLAAPGAVRAEEGEIVDINANYMEMIDEKKLIIFTGDVVAKKGKVTIYSSKLDVYYVENPATKSKDIDHMLATGNVKIVQDDKIGTGTIGRYFKGKDMMILEGNPATVREKAENQVTGSKITFYLKENRSVVEGNRPRVIFRSEK